MKYFINAFISGVLFYVDLFVNSWWWALIAICFGLMCYLDNKEIDDIYVDDDRDIL